MQTQNKDLWLKTIPERVEEGACMQELTPISEEMSNSQRIIISFSRKSSSNPSPFRPGDVCLLSNKKNVAIAFTVIDYVSDDVIKVSSDKIVKSRYEAPFHLDKYTSMSTHSTTLGNLIYFLQNDEIGQVSQYEMLFILLHFSETVYVMFLLIYCLQALLIQVYLISHLLLKK